MLHRALSDRSDCANVRGVKSIKRQAHKACQFENLRKYPAAQSNLRLAMLAVQSVRLRFSS